jgi:hypothetical protein
MNATMIPRPIENSLTRDIERLHGVTQAVHAAGVRLLALFSPQARPRNRAEMLAATAVLAVQPLFVPLLIFRPG